MEQQLIKLLDNSLECTSCKIKNNQIILAIQSVKEKLI